MARRPNEDQGYDSNSSIDNPPREPREGDDEKPQKAEDLLDGEKVFTIDLSLTLTEKGSKPIKVPLVAGTMRGLIVEQALRLGMQDRKNLTIIRAILDNPSQREAVQLSIVNKEIF